MSIDKQEVEEIEKIQKNKIFSEITETGSRQFEIINTLAKRSQSIRKSRCKYTKYQYNFQQ